MYEKEVSARNVDHAREDILYYIQHRSRETNKVIYFNGWDGFGTAPVLVSILQGLQSIKAKKASSELYYDTIIYIDCSAWESRRMIQKKIAGELNLLDLETMAMFDKQDEEDDFNGVEYCARDIITGVWQVIAETLIHKKCIMVFLNGSDEEVHVNMFGINPDYCEHLTVWAFNKRSLTIHNRLREISDKLRYTHVFFFTSSNAASLTSSKFNAVLLQEADTIVARHPCMRGIDSAMVKDCCLYELFLQCNFHGVTGFDWAAHASNYWICDGIMKEDVTREIINILHQEICWEYDDPSLLGSLFEKLNGDSEAPFLVLKDNSESTEYKKRPCRWICITSKNLIVHEDIQSVLQKSTTLVVALEESNSPQGLPNGFLEQCSKLGVLILSCCAFSFTSPPFLDCHVLKFLGLHHCTHDNTSYNQEKNNIKWDDCLRNLLVLDIRYTDWDEILSEEKMGLMDDLIELNIEGAGGSWQYTRRLQGRLPRLRRLRIIKPTNQYQEEKSTDSSNSFLGKTELEILDFSGNKGMRNIPTSLSTSRSLQVLILDGCDGLENVALPSGLPSSLRSFSFDGYGPMDHWTSSFKLPLESSRPKPPSREDESDIKTSKISLQGCTQLETLFVRGLPNLVEIDLSGSAIKLLDLDTMVVHVPELKRIFLLGCEHLRAIKWGPHVRTVLKLELVCIDTRPRRRAHGFTRPPLARHKSFSLQLHAVLADARLIRSLCPLLDYNNYQATYFNVRLSSSTDEYSGGVEFKAGGTEIIEHSNNQQHRVQAISRYGDVFTEIGNAMLDFPKPPTEQLDHHVEIRDDGSRCLESELANPRSHPYSLQYLMAWLTESIHVHDTSASMCTPAWGWYRLKWCRVERCPNLNTVFPPDAYDLKDKLQTIWASDLLKAQCIWSKGSRYTLYSSFKNLQHLHLRSCPRIRFSLPVWVDSFPSLETLHIIRCGDLRHVFELNGRYPKKIAEVGVRFLKLTTIHLHDLPKLEQIMCGVEMLETIRIRGCFALRRLPASQARRSRSSRWRRMCGTRWSGVEATPGTSRASSSRSCTRATRLLRGTVLR